jgi:hypothetical protein
MGRIWGRRTIRPIGLKNYTLYRYNPVQILACFIWRSSLMKIVLFTALTSCRSPSPEVSAMWMKGDQLEYATQRCRTSHVAKSALYQVRRDVYG